MIRLYRIKCASLRYIICMLRMVLITQSLVSFRHRIFGLRYPLQAPPTPSRMITTQCCPSVRICCFQCHTPHMSDVTWSLALCDSCHSRDILKALPCCRKWQSSSFLVAEPCPWRGPARLLCPVLRRRALGRVHVSATGSTAAGSTDVRTSPCEGRFPSFSRRCAAEGLLGHRAA